MSDARPHNTALDLATANQVGNRRLNLLPWFQLTAIVPGDPEGPLFRDVDILEADVIEPKLAPVN